MKITYLGTGAAEGIPAAFCNCAFCKAAREKGELRTRAQVLIDDELSIDFPPDAFYHAARFGKDFSAIKYLLVTHSHMDHFYAHDFILRGYKYADAMTSPVLDIYGNAETEKVFSECTRREMREEVEKNMRFHTLSAFEEARFGGYAIYPLMARHSSQEPLVYLVEKDGKRILHLTDTGLLPDEDYEYLARLGGAPCSLVTLDCTFLWDEAPENARHMGLRENAAVLKRLQKIGFVDSKTQKVITHFSHNGAPTEEKLKRAEEQFGYLAAYDGMELKI